ncbi:hypothetical protein niasHS_011047 [Heterodera schachtii]|uniref:tRNA (uracil(54)-C(5))-methyltransferase n=1 Tax=Heterodera schachtii TaxID=97005 RepID=A0ABD2J004_HETSC
MDSEECAERAIHLLDNAIFKKNCLSVTKANDLPKCPKTVSVAQTDEVEKSCKKLVTPLFDVPYEEQLKIKFDHSKRVLELLQKKLTQANATNSLIAKESLPKNVLPSPLVDEYRNKCEFSVGYSSGDNRSPVVGFMSGKMVNRQCNVLAPDECSNLTRNTRSIVRHFEAFVRKFGEEPFDEFERKGFWKMLTVKDFSGDTMIIVTVHPHPNSEVTHNAKTKLSEFFLPSDPFRDEAAQFNVTSFYWQEQANAGDERIYEHVAGAPFVYESLLGLNFRISPSTFFQVNTRATETLYETIGNLLGLPSAEKGDLGKDEITQLFTTEKRPFVVLDVCCGAGTISLCLMQRIRKAILSLPSPSLCPISFGCVGIELNREAVRDARKNASENGFDAKSCIYIDGEAERIFKELEYHMPSGCPLNSSQIFGVIDPPRAGVSDKVIIGCRRLNSLLTLCYVSCDPKAATKNLIDLCRPPSRKFDGDPFRIVDIQPVDLFPQTEHVEWVIKLKR